MGFLVFPGWTVREVKSPLTAEMLEPFTASAGTVYFNSTLTDSDCMRLADWMRNYPELGLRVGDGIDDLEFLRFFPFISSGTSEPQSYIAQLDRLMGYAICPRTWRVSISVTRGASST